MHLRFVSHRDSSCFHFADKVNVAEEGRIKQVLVTGYVRLVTLQYVALYYLCYLQGQL